MEEILELEAKGWAVKRIADHFKVGDSSIYTQTQAAVHRLEVAYRPALTGRGSGCKDYTYQLRRFSDKQALIHEINFDPQPEAT